MSTSSNEGASPSGSVSHGRRSTGGSLTQKRRSSVAIAKQSAARLSISTRLFLQEAKKSHVKDTSVNSKKNILTNCWIIHVILLPESFFRQVWDFLTAIAVIILAWKVPFTVAFPGYLFETEEWNNFDIFLEIFFWIDIVINFRTGYSFSGRTITDPKKVAMHYLKTWFFVDFLALLPLELIVEGASASGGEGFDQETRQGFKMSRIVKLGKLLRMGRLVRYLRNYFKYRHVIAFFTSIVFVTHWVACLWMVVETSIDDTRWYRVLDGAQDISNLYFEVLDEVFLHMLGIARQTDTELRGGEAQYTFSIFVSVLGAGQFSMLIAASVTLVSGVSSTREKFVAKMTNIDLEMDSLAISSSLRQRIKAYYDYLWINKKGSEFNHGVSIYNDPDLAEALKKDVANELVHSQFPLRKVRVLQKCSDECLAAIFLKMKTHIFMPGSFVANEGEVGRELYYLNRGKVVITTVEMKTHLMEKTEGDFFGEIALLMNIRRTASVRAVTIVELLVLTKEDLFEVFLDFPEYEAVMKAMAKKHLSDLNNLKKTNFDKRLSALRERISIMDPGREKQKLESVLRQDTIKLNAIEQATGNAMFSHGPKPQARVIRGSDDSPKSLPNPREPANWKKQETNIEKEKTNELELKEMEKECKAPAVRVKKEKKEETVEEEPQIGPSPMTSDDDHDPDLQSEQRPWQTGDQVVGDHPFGINDQQSQQFQQRPSINKGVLAQTKRERMGSFSQRSLSHHMAEVETHMLYPNTCIDLYFLGNTFVVDITIANVTEKTQYDFWEYPMDHSFDIKTYMADQPDQDERVYVQRQSVTSSPVMRIHIPQSVLIDWNSAVITMHKNRINVTYARFAYANTARSTRNTGMQHSSNRGERHSSGVGAGLLPSSNPAVSPNPPQEYPQHFLHTNSGAGSRLPSISGSGMAAALAVESAPTLASPTGTTSTVFHLPGPALRRSFTQKHGRAPFLPMHGQNDSQHSSSETPSPIPVTSPPGIPLSASPLPDSK